MKEGILNSAALKEITGYKREACLKSFLEKQGIAVFDGKNGPSAAKKVREYLSRLFNWGMNRNYCTINPVKKPEMPQERKLQRLPEKNYYPALLHWLGSVAAKTILPAGMQR